MKPFFLLLLLLLTGCSRTPYMQGYHTGHAKGVEDSRLEDKSAPWHWDNTGNTLCPFAAGLPEFDLYVRGYRDGYDHGGQGIWTPLGPDQKRMPGT